MHHRHNLQVLKVQVTRGSRGMPSGKSFEIWVVGKVLSRWQKLWSRQRRKKKLAPQAQLVLKVQVTRGLWGHAPLAKVLKSGPLRMYLRHSGAKIRVFEQNTDIIEFWLLWGSFPKKSRWQVHVK